ncbi:MAG: nucleotidyltransferase [Chitinophagaceae bacterium]|nr:MAG: nucleotidyltransferase [Chitinophagaceae bacterium]
MLQSSNAQVLLRCISGSRAYGLNTPQSDTDIRGVFFLNRREYYGLYHLDQVANNTNDIVYYELKRFIELLLRNNPNLLELLNTPGDCILHRHPVMDRLRPEMFLSRLCYQSFAGYAQTQIRKAKGLNKKIFNPVARERKTVGDFCHIIEGYRTIPLNAWLQINGISQEACGLVNIPHAQNLYALFIESQLASSHVSGIYSGPEANDVKLSSIPEELQPKAILSFNKDGYSSYCKDYREYWEWVTSRNDVRYENTLEHGKNYDAKNMMHTFRLLHMAAEIATEKKVNVRRLDREFLLSIRQGKYSYEDLVVMASERLERMALLYAQSDLPEQPDEKMANELLIAMRVKLYKGSELET